MGRVGRVRPGIVAGDVIICVMSVFALLVSSEMYSLEGWRLFAIRSSLRRQLRTKECGQSLSIWLWETRSGDSRKGDY